LFVVGLEISFCIVPVRVTIGVRSRVYFAQVRFLNFVIWWIVEPW
jgi:hypothetical protein